jgi:hypothetical protein
MHRLLVALVFASLTSVYGASAQEYEVPPSSTTTTSVPYISDDAMKECVKLFNEAKWLSEEIDGTEVDSYSQDSVDSYNEMVARHTNMTDAFNRDCSGKQSESAYRAAQELNQGK